MNFEFPWPSVKVVLDGSSILDVPRLELKTMEEATAFVQAYGFDPNQPEDLNLIWSFFNDAVEFIEKVFAAYLIVDSDETMFDREINNAKEVFLYK